MKHKILDSSWGIFKYLFWRNDHSWQLLTENEKNVIRKANFSHNNVRPDYFDPEKYNGGVSFDSNEDRTKSARGKYIQKFLDTHKPKSIIEIGPGSGYHTQQLVHYPSVETYYAIDINKGFLDFLAPRLDKVSTQKPFTYQLFTTDEFAPKKIQADAVILLSIVHHDPERIELFERIKQSLSTGGTFLPLTHPIIFIVTKNFYVTVSLLATFQKNSVKTEIIYLPIISALWESIRPSAERSKT
jgi:SAM-dependent methyltransferase